MYLKNKLRISLMMLFFLTPFIASAKIIVTSIPKCGTHLLVRCVNEITGLKSTYPCKTWTSFYGKDKEVEFLEGHIQCTAGNLLLIHKNGFKGVFILRDPRDQCVSMIHFARWYPADMWPKLTQPDFSQAIQSWILDTSLIVTKREPMWTDEKIRTFRGLDDFYGRYLGWIDHPLFYTTTFEKLVGPRGGGSKEEQIQEIMNIANHLDHPISLARAEEIAESLFGKVEKKDQKITDTFRSGQIGSWKSTFTENDKEVFKKTAGQLLIKLGYEKDLNW